MTDVGYDGEIMQHAFSDSETCTCIAYSIHVRRQKLRLFANIVAVHYHSYQRSNKYLYTVVDQPFDMFNFHD